MPWKPTARVIAVRARNTEPNARLSSPAWRAPEARTRRCRGKGGVPAGFLSMPIHRLTRVFFAVAALLSASGAHAAAQSESSSATSYSTQARPMTVLLDARDASHGLMTAHLTIPARPGAFELAYPKWIPGEHGPTGPLRALSALHVSANGRELAWERDKVDLYGFRVEVPPGAGELHVDFTVLVNGAGDTMATQNVAIINWNRDLLYQTQTDSRNVFAKASIILPHGWDYGCALPNARRTGDRVDFGEVTLETLIDSPLDMGRYYKHFALWSGDGATDQMDVFADRPQDLEISKPLLAAYARLVPQGLALYGSRHWTHYHSLLTLSDAIGFQGIEHHQSSDDRAPDDFFTNPKEQMIGGDLLPHEFSHSWNGKYRRPEDLATPNFQIPEKTDLLWVYEGMNQYLGDVLTYRSGITAPKLYPEYFASIYARMDNEPGRLSDPLIDTATAAPYLYGAAGDWSSIRRTAGDFYTEGELLWLDVDTIIREASHGSKSLDTFLHAYAGPPSGEPRVVTYTRAQIEQLLNGVQPYDWHGFFERYVYSISTHPPTDEIARAGWRLVYNAKPNAFIEARESLAHGSIDDWYSVGLQMGGDGVVRDVRLGSPAYRAGLSPGVRITAVNGQAFDSSAWNYALKEAQRARKPITLIAEHTKWLATYTITYYGGPRYPHLVRIPGTPDMLGRIMAAR